MANAPKTGGIHAPVTPSPELGAIVGTAPLLRSQVISKVWDHIKKNNLQNPANKREILADDKLKKVFGTDKCSMFEMNKHISKHVKAYGSSPPNDGAPRETAGAPFAFKSGCGAQTIPFPAKAGAKARSASDGAICPPRAPPIFDRRDAPRQSMACAPALQAD